MHIEQGAAGVAGIDGTVRLNQLHADAAGHSNLPVQGTDGAGGQGEGQLAQRVADGNHTVAHVQVIGIADDHRGQALRIDLQHRHIVALIKANDPGIVLGTVISGNGNGVGALHHMVVGQDIAVVRKEEAGTGRGGGGPLAPEIGGYGGGDNAHSGIHIGGIDFRGREGFAGIDLLDLQNGSLPDALHHRGHAVGEHRLGLALAHQTAAQKGAAHTHAAAYQGAHQNQGNGFPGAGLFMLFLARHLGHLLRGGLLLFRSLIQGIIKIFAHFEHSFCLPAAFFHGFILAGNPEKKLKGTANVL